MSLTNQGFFEFLEALSQFATKSADSIAGERERIDEQIGQVIRWRVWVEREVPYFNEQTQKWETYKKKLEIDNTLDNIMHNIYSLGARSEGLKNVNRVVLDNMISADRHLGIIYAIRERIASRQKELLEAQKEKGTKEVSKSTDQVTMDTLLLSLGISINTVRVETLWQFEEKVFLNFLKKSAHYVLMEVIPNISRNLPVSAVPFGFEPSDDQSILKALGQSKEVSEYT